MNAWILPRVSRTTRVLALACTGLCTVIAAELAASPPAPPSSAPTPSSRGPAASVDANDGFAMPPLSAYGDVLARPLFSDTRRPAAVAAAAANARSTFVLVGTILSRQERSALIKHGQPSHIDHVVEGQTVDGWIVESIAPDRVVFANAGARVSVTAKGETRVTSHAGSTDNRSSGTVSSVPSSSLSKD